MKSKNLITKKRSKEIVDLNNTEYQRVFYAYRTMNPTKSPEQIRRMTLRKMREK